MPRPGVARRLPDRQRRLRQRARTCGSSLAVAPVQEAVVVSATRTEAPLAQLATSVTVFDAADIERRQNPPLLDLLRTAPGAVVVANGSRGAVASLFLRGGESNYTKVLLDGIPLNEPGGTFDFGNVTTENLERVELVRGAQSALFGSDAMAGRRSDVHGAARRPARPRAGVMVEGGHVRHRAGRRPARPGAPGELDYSVGAARVTHEQRRPEQRVRQHDAVGHRRAWRSARRATAAFHRTRRARARSARRDRRHSAAPTSTRSSGAATASAA